MAQPALLLATMVITLVFVSLVTKERTVSKVKYRPMCLMSGLPRCKKPVNFFLPLLSCAILHSIVSVPFFFFFCFTSLVSLAGFYTEVDPHVIAYDYVFV